MATKKYLSLERLPDYTALIKDEIKSGDELSLSSAKSYTDTKVSSITNGDVIVKEAEHSASADSASNADHSVSSDSAIKATQDASGNVITETYETKEDAQLKYDTITAAKADWNQNDESAIDYVKNRPFYEEDPEEFYPLPEMTINDNTLQHGQTYIAGSMPIEVGVTYEVILNGEVYSAECYQGTIGASLGDSTLETLPFYIFDGGYASGISFPPQEEPVTIAIRGYVQNIKKLERKFIDGIAGMDVEGKVFEYDGKQYTAYLGAEIFNDYSGSNKAMGHYSHAEGYGTKAINGMTHAEGYGTVAKANYSHSEGQYTIASGMSQHVQGKYNIEDTSNTYAHIVGNGTSSASSNAHTLDWDGNAWFAGNIRVGGTEYDNGSEVALKSDLANIDLSKYETKTDSQSKLDDAKAYADSAAFTVKNDLLNGAGAAYDTLKELGDLIDENQDAIGALETVAANKADKEHTHDGVYEVAGSIETAKTEIKTYVDEQVASRVVVQIHTWEADD